MASEGAIGEGGGGGAERGDSGARTPHGLARPAAPMHGALAAIYGQYLCMGARHAWALAGIHGAPRGVPGRYTWRGQKKSPLAVMLAGSMARELCGSDGNPDGRRIAKFRQRHPVDADSAICP